jgi:hypothetical protein
VGGVNRPTFAVRNNHRVAQFADAVTTETFYTFNMPSVFAEGDIEVKLKWMAASAIAGDVIWAVAFERHQDSTDDLDTDSFAADVIAAATTTPAISGQPITTTIALTSAQYDGILQGDQFRIRVRRLGSNGSDTMTDTAQLMTLVIDQLADPPGGGGGFFTDGVGTRAGIGKGSPAPLAGGLEALAQGTSADASGANAFAFGASAEAAAPDSFSFGTNSYVKAAGVYGIAIGRGSQVRTAGIRGIAIGYGANVRDDRGLAVGEFATARGAKSVAIGPYAEAADNAPDTGFAVAIGYKAYATGEASIAIGKNAWSYKTDHIGIGRDLYLYKDNRILAIGSNINVGATLASDDTIAIGRTMTIDGNNNAICIGKNISDPGDRSIVLTNYHNGSTGTNSNILLSCSTGVNAGIKASGTASIGYNIVLVTDDSGINNYNNNASLQNILLGTEQAYIYGQSERNVAIGNYIDLGDFNNQIDSNFSNVVIGSGRLGYFSNGGIYTKYNSMIGHENYIGTGARYSVCIGSRNYVYAGFASAYKPTYGQIAIGRSNRVDRGHGNVAMGYSCQVVPGTYTTSTWSRGNFAIGYECEIIKTGTGSFRSTMAQGVGALVGVSGQRCFSDDQTTVKNVKPNQGSFIIPKVETTNATQTTILTFPTASDKAYAIWGYMVARRTDADGFNAAFSLGNSLVYRNAAGAPVLVGDPVAWTMDANQGAPAWSIDVTIATNDVVVRVTGTAAQTIEWLGWVQVIEVRG